MQERHKTRQAGPLGEVQTASLRSTPQFALAPARLYNQPTAANQTHLPGLESTGQKS
jgi:hypothetical protein